MWQILQAASLVTGVVQKLLISVFLPRSWPCAFLYSHFQCSVLCSCLEASVWQLRQALVTSGPELNSCCSALNRLWSAVDFSNFPESESDAASTAGASSMAAIRAAMNIPVRIIAFPFTRVAPIKTIVVTRFN